MLKEPEEELVPAKRSVKAEQSRLYRERKKSKEWLSQQAERSRNQRRSMTDEQRKHYNEKAKERMRRLRERKVQGARSGNSEPSASNSVKWSEARNKRERRQYKTMKQREYRSKMTGNQKRAYRQKDRQYRRRRAAEDKAKKRADRPQAPKEDRASRYARRMQKQNPEEFAQTISHLIEQASPSKQKALHSRGIFREKTRNSITKAIRDITKKAKNVVVNVLRKNLPQNRKGLSAVIGLGRSTLSRKAPIGRSKYRTSQSIIEEVQKFYMRADVSTIMPNKKRGAKDEYFYVMQRSLLATYKEFSVEHPNKIGFVTFYNLKPKNVHLLRKQKWLQCVCDICANIKAMSLACKVSMCKHGFDVPGWLDGGEPVSIGLETLCSGQEAYAKTCLERKCDDCGIKIVTKDLELWASDNIQDCIKWKEWKKEAVIVRNTEVQKLKLVEMRASRKQFVHQFKLKLEAYGSHCFFARWQQKQYRENASSLEENEIIAVVDFSENFTCKQQSEAQSAYYSHTQVTIFPAVCFYKGDQGVIRDSVIFVTDDLKHDAGAVHAFMHSLVDHLKMDVPALKISIWSDGCASQFKSKQPFANLASKFGHKDLDIE